MISDRLTQITVQCPGQPTGVLNWDWIIQSQFLSDFIEALDAHIGHLRWRYQHAQRVTRCQVEQSKYGRCNQEQYRNSSYQSRK